MKNLYIVLAIALLASCQPKSTTPDQLLRVPYQSTAMKVERDFFVYLPAGYGVCSATEAVCDWRCKTRRHMYKFGCQFKWFTSLK